MTQDNANQSAAAGSCGAGPCSGPISMRSMAKICMGMMGRRPPMLLLVLPGILLIGLGALIVIEPQVLVWLLAAGAVLLGAMLLLMAGLMRRRGARQHG